MGSYCFRGNGVEKGRGYVPHEDYAIYTSSVSVVVLNVLVGDRRSKYHRFQLIWLLACKNENKINKKWFD